jgi:hypothetical protein
MPDEIFIGGDEGVVHATAAFVRPSDILDDPSLTSSEKRELLAWWASDACAVASAPALRRLPGGATVSWDEIMTALRRLDAGAKRTFCPLGAILPSRQTSASKAAHRSLL